MVKTKIVWKFDKIKIKDEGLFSSNPVLNIRKSLSLLKISMLLEILRNCYNNTYDIRPYGTRLLKK